jgi:hypothetical protein
MINAMNNKLVILIISAIICFAFAPDVWSVDSPLTDSYFLGEVPNAAAIGMGGAYTAMTGNPFAPYWNPAGLVTVKRSNLGVSMNIYSDSDLDQDLVEETFPLEASKLNYISVCGEQVGFYWRTLSNRIDVSTYTLAGTDYEERIDEKVNVFGITVAVPHSGNVDFGMNMNLFTGMLGYYIIEGSTPTVYISDGIGWGLDWGLLYNLDSNISFGVTVHNFPAMIYWEDFRQNTLPVIFRGGVNLRLSNLMAVGIDYESADYDESLAGDDLMHFGIEQFLTSSVIIRAGMYGNDFNDKYAVVYTTGLGFKKEEYSIDLAAKRYYIDNTESGKVTRLSLSGVIPF